MPQWPQAGWKIRSTNSRNLHFATRVDTARGESQRTRIAEPRATALRVKRKLVPLDLAMGHAHGGRTNHGPKHGREEMLFRVVAPDGGLDAPVLESPPGRLETNTNPTEERSFNLSLRIKEGAFHGGWRRRGHQLLRSCVERVRRSWA